MTHTQCKHILHHYFALYRPLMMMTTSGIQSDLPSSTHWLSPSRARRAIFARTSAFSEVEGETASTNVVVVSIVHHIVQLHRIPHRYLHVLLPIF